MQKVLFGLNLKSMKTEYKNYTIEESKCSYTGTPEFMFYKTSQGVDHDYDLDGEDYTYCGNCKWASTLEDAKDEIDELTYEEIN